MKRHFLWFVPAALLLGGCLAEDVMIHQVGAEGRDDYGMLGSESAVSNTSGNFLNNLSFAGDFNRDPGGVLLRLERLFSHISREEALCAMAELSLHYARSGVEPDQAVRGYLSAALYCQQYLATVDRPQEVPYSPRRLRMVRVSNLAQTELFGYLRDRELLVKTSYQLLTLTGYPVRFVEPDFRMPLADEEIADVELCSDYRTSKLSHVSYRFGLGVPLIWRLQGRHELWERLHSRSTETLPGTAVLTFKEDPNTRGYTAQWHCLDILQTDKFALADNREVPLEMDLSTPLAYITRKQPLLNYLAYTFLPEESRQMAGLYMLQPYDPKRIPVVFVHGLMSNMRTWIQMINTLQNDPVIRERYQFWGYTYSSGNPVLTSACEMRKAFDRTVAAARMRDPDNRLDQMVVVGHSMGGLLSKTLLQDARGHLLEMLTGRKGDFAELTAKLEPAEKELVRDMFEYEPRTYVKRMVFLAVPHRGAELATSPIGRLGTKLIRLPRKMVTRGHSIAQRLFAKDRLAELGDVSLRTGIDNLEPNNPVLNALMKLPFRPGVPFHSIIGNEDKANVPDGTDGVVPYASAHLDDATSETVVLSDHSVQQKLPAILELRRILHQHLHELEQAKKPQEK